MKISLAWIFDHIDADWRQCDVAHLVTRFNQATAEIESYAPYTLNLHFFTLARVSVVDERSVTLFSPEWNKEYTLSARTDARIDDWFLLKKDSNLLEMGEDFNEEVAVEWSTLADLHSAKEGLMPALTVEESLAAGGWKKHVEAHDIILEIDNKSITHRPDLWGHVGLAREVAALLGLAFKPLPHTDCAVEYHETEAHASFTVSNRVTQACKRLCGLYCRSVENRPSAFSMAVRLAKVDARPINLIVDVTNYVMLDMGQPMHAFDADAIPAKTIMPRFAKSGEKITLLDGQTIELANTDLVIADDAAPLALAGIMGGKRSAITLATRALFIEAACFDATTIRHASARHKIRTEASARFEKSLDPEQALRALGYFVYLVKKFGGAIACDSSAVCVGPVTTPQALELSHEFLCKRLGVMVDESFVLKTLQALGFQVAVHKGLYQVQVPSWRATKDIRIKEDLVEEVGRMFGYDALTPQLPYKQVEVSDLSPVYNLRALKRHCAFALSMREVATYGFFDEEFLRVVRYEPEGAVGVRNPVSENWRRLVTSLIPHLMKAIVVNNAEHDALRFFESARTWHKDGEQVIENKSLAGIIYEKKKEVDFYSGKQMLASLFDVLSVPVHWDAMEQPSSPWYLPHQSAYLRYEDTIIGRAGIINPLFLHTVVQGSGFIFELDAAFLQAYKPAVERYVPLAKYPDVVRDVSFLVPLEVTAQELCALIKDVHPSIKRVDLMDFFEKDTWKDKRSLTFRFVIQDEAKTLTKAEVDQLYAQVVQALEGQGAEIR